MSSTGSVNRINKGVTISLWLVYALIVFEILYMISPFAFYYYSAYAAPLKILQQSPATSWLVFHLLPHFTFQTSLMISVLLLISWPLITIGLILFLLAFAQIYYGKFFSKGAVSGGLYRFIRHPQYLALAVLGLGTTIYWPRFIVFIMYAVMLFLYYFLARQEERICLAKFGESYESYHDNTGMFLPKAIESRLPDFPSLLPEKGLKRFISILGLFVIYLAVVIAAGNGIKDYALTRIKYIYSERQAIVSVAPLSRNQINRAVSVALMNPEVENLYASLEKKLVYICPTQWGIPELGIQGKGESVNYFMHPETHGNSLDFDQSLLTILITKPVLLSKDIKGKDILKKSVSFDPLHEIQVDLEQNKVLTAKKRTSRGKWDGVPVPIY